MRKILYFISAIVALFAIFTLSSCGGEEQGGNGNVTLVLDRTDMDMSVGDVYTVSWSVIPRYDESSSVSWKSSDPAIVSCDGGVIRAVGEGRTIVTATHSSGAYRVIAITVENDTNKLYMLEGDSLQLSASDMEIALEGAVCISSDGDIATVSKSDGGVTVSANKKGMCDIRLETENASIIYYDLVVLSKENSGVNITTDEFPMVVNYDAGRYQSAVKITDIAIEKRDTRLYLDQKTVQVEISYMIEKIYDSEGNDSLNPTRFIIEVYSPESDSEGPLRELEVHTGWTTVENVELKRFVYTFNVDFELGDGERSFTFKIKEIEEKE